MDNARSIADIKKRNLNFSSGEKGKNDFIDSIELPPILENAAAEVKIPSLLTLSRSFFQLLATSAVKPGENTPLIPHAVPPIPPMRREMMITIFKELEKSKNAAKKGNKSPIIRVFL